MSDRKRAIETLKQLRLDYEEFYEEHNNEVTQAYDMAIASLETDEAYDLEYEQPKFCKDCISREAVYYYISSHINEIITESGTDKNAHTNAILRSLANGVKLMPSVLPDVPDNNVGNIDCISRADAKAKKIYSHERHEYVVPVAEIDWLPSVTPQEPTYCPKFRNQQEKHRVFHTVTAVEKFFSVIGNDDVIDDISVLKELVRKMEVEE